MTRATAVHLEARPFAHVGPSRRFALCLLGGERLAFAPTLAQVTCRRCIVRLLERIAETADRRTITPLGLPGIAAWTSEAP